MKPVTLAVQCGIYNTEYTIKDYKGHIVVIAPYISWVNGSGNLTFVKYTIGNRNQMDIIRNMANKESLTAKVNNSSGILTIDDILNGHGKNCIVVR